MNNFVVWLDSEEAKIFELKPAGIESSHLKKVDTDHHRRHKKDSNDNHNTLHYFHDLTLKIKSADQLLLLGPGLAKTHFKSHIESHLPDTLAKKIIGLENLENVSDNQIMAAAHKFFKHYDLFN